MKKRLKKNRPHPRIKGFFLGLLYVAVLTVPAALSFILLSFYHSNPRELSNDLRVEITDSALEENYNRFKPRKIFDIGMYITDLSEIDISERTFTSRFIFWGKNFYDKSVNDRSVLKDPPFNLVGAFWIYLNQRAKQPIKNNEDPSYLSYISYEGVATLKNEFYLADYPFDIHKLRFIFEPKDETANEIFLGVDANSSLANDFSLGEWDIKSFRAFSDIQTAESDFSDPKLIESGSLWTYIPRVVFEIEIQRHLLSHFIKEFLPLFIVLLMVYTNLYVRPSEFESRSKAAFTAFLSIAALHWGASGNQTGVSYLTAMDQFFIVAYGLVLLLIIEAVFSRALCDEEHEKENLKTHPWFVHGIPIFRIIYPLVLVGGWYWISVNAMM